VGGGGVGCEAEGGELDGCDAEVDGLDWWPGQRAGWHWWQKNTTRSEASLFCFLGVPLFFVPPNLEPVLVNINSDFYKIKIRFRVLSKKKDEEGATWARTVRIGGTDARKKGR
jgi:hypothetical protein